MKRAAVLAVALVLCAPDALAEPHSAMGRATKELRCASSDKGVSAVLDRLATVDTTRLGVPAEDFAGGELRARALDRLLVQLAGSKKRYPALGTRIESTVLGWSFCAVRFEDKPWNLSGGASPKRSAATGEFPGFRAWGFGHEKGWAPPRLLSDGPLGPGLVEHFMHAVQRERCFPNPATGHTIFEDDDVDPSIAAPLLGEAEAPLSEDVDDEPEEACVEPKKKPTAPKMPEPKPPKPEAAPVTVAIAPTTHEGQAAQVPVPGVNHVSGSFYTGHTLKGVPLYGARVSVNPYKFFFARTGIEARHPNGDWTGSTSWGVGYDDWHPGSIYLQLNNWAIPTNKPEFFKGAAFDGGYRFPIPDKVARYVGASAGVNIPFEGPIGLVSSMTLKPFGDWFVMAGVRTTPADFSQWTWVYGFGLFNWRPFTVSAQYSNWGPNKAFKPNFLENGAVTASFSWGF